jgi:hypothetical protein
LPREAARAFSCLDTIRIAVHGDCGMKYKYFISIYEAR